MRFTRAPRISFTWTRRKQAAAARRLQRHLDAAPLLAPLLAPLQPTLTQIEAARRTAWTTDEAATRAARAARWRAARRALYALPSLKRQEVLATWNHAGYPASPEYLLDLIRRNTHGPR